MCTLSIFSRNNDLIITMNRDEQRSRTEEGRLNIKGSYCFPIDSLSQGTWIGMNDKGLVGALLNRYQDTHDLSAAKSRGGIIPKFLQYETIEDAFNEAGNYSFKGYNPFDFILVDTKEIIHIKWDGMAPVITKQDLQTPFFITSSSERINEVLKYRHSVFDTLEKECRSNPQTILSTLHLQCEDKQSESSILMQREKTHTKSIVQIILKTTQAYMSYWPEGMLKEDGIQSELTLSTEQAICHGFLFASEEQEQLCYRT